MISQQIQKQSAKKKGFFRRKSNTSVSQRKKMPIFSSWILLFVFCFSTFGPTFAITKNADVAIGYNTSYAAEPSNALDGFITIAGYISNFFITVVAFEVGMTGGLMDNTFVMGKGEAVSRIPTDRKDIANVVTDIGSFLNLLWIIVRDLVNYIFILVLLVIAFYTVITAGSEGEGGFSVKKILPKFVIAVVLVNFTWFGAKIVLDTANVATNIIYGIPSSITALQNSTGENLQLPGKKDRIDGECGFITTDSEKGIKDYTCPLYLLVAKMNAKDDGTEYTFDEIGEAVTKKKGWSEKEKVSDENLQKTITEKMKIVSKEEGKIITYDLGFLTLYFTPLQSGLEQLNVNTIGSLMAFSILDIHRWAMTDGTPQTVGSLTLSILVSFFVMIIIIIIFTTFFLVMLERVIVIWINIILSPIWALVYVLKDTPLSFDMNSGEGNLLGPKAFVSAAFLPAMISFPLVFGLTLFSIINATGGRLEITKNLPFDIFGTTNVMKGISNLEQLFWYIIAIVIMWQSIKIAEKQTVIVNNVISGIRGFAEKAGTEIIKTPLYLPFVYIPGKNGEKDTKPNTSLAALTRAVNILPSMRNQRVNQQANALLRRNSPIDTITNPNLKRIANDIVRKNLTGGDFSGITKKTLKSTFGITNLSNYTRTDVIDYIDKLGRDKGINSADIEAAKSNLNNINAFQKDSSASTSNNSTTTQTQTTETTQTTDEK